jgi:hypothetical protein
MPMIPAGKRRMFADPLVVAALVGMLVWLADQPTVPGYNPLRAMSRDPGVDLSRRTVHSPEGPPEQPPAGRLRPNEAGRKR